MAKEIPAEKTRGGKLRNTGRPKGALNKTTRTLKEAVAAMYDGVDLPTYFAGLKPDLQVRLLIGLAPYILSRPDTNVNLTAKEGVRFEFVVQGQVPEGKVQRICAAELVSAGDVATPSDS